MEGIYNIQPAYNLEPTWESSLVGGQTRIGERRIRTTKQRGGEKVTGIFRILATEEQLRDFQICEKAFGARRQIREVHSTGLQGQNSA